MSKNRKEKKFIPICEERKPISIKNVLLLTAGCDYGICLFSILVYYTKILRYLFVFSVVFVCVAVIFLIIELCRRLRISQLHDKRDMLEAEGDRIIADVDDVSVKYRWFSAKVAGYTIKVFFEYDGIEYMWISPRYAVHPYDYISNKKCIVLIKDGCICLAKNQKIQVVSDKMQLKDTQDEIEVIPEKEKDILFDEEFLNQNYISYPVELLKQKSETAESGQNSVDNQNKLCTSQKRQYFTPKPYYRRKKDTPWWVLSYDTMGVMSLLVCLPSGLCLAAGLSDVSAGRSHGGWFGICFGALLIIVLIVWIVLSIHENKRKNKKIKGYKYKKNKKGKK